MSTELDDLLAATAQYELEKFLHSPQRLPVHDFRKAQRLWAREPDTLSLFTVSVTAPHTDIALTRDPLTGAHVGFCEVHNTSGNLTAKNSTSMQRAPGPPTKNIKGESTDLPFWPGTQLPNSTYLIHVGQSSGQLAQCLDKLLTGYVLKYACKVEGLLYQSVSSTDHMVLSALYQRKFWEVYQIVGSKKGMVSMRQFLLMMMDCGLIGMYLSSSDVIEFITCENSQASTDPPHSYNLEVLITYLEFCEGLISCALRWQERHNQQDTVISSPVPTLKVESTHSNMSGVGSGTMITQKSSHGLTGNKQLAQVLPAHQASRISVESASSLSGRRAAIEHPPAVTTTTTTTTIAKGDSKTDMSPPLKIPSKHSMGLALSPIEESKSNTSVVNTPTSGPADEPDDKGSPDQPNAPKEQDETTTFLETIKIILEEYIFPHYGVTLT